MLTLQNLLSFNSNLFKKNCIVQSYGMTDSMVPCISVLFQPSWHSVFLHQQNWSLRFNWNIVDSGGQHHNCPRYFNQIFLPFLYLTTTVPQDAMLSACFKTEFNITSLSVEWDISSVLTSPGCIQVTLIPHPQTSCLRACDNPSTKNLVPEYTARPGNPW